MVSKITFGILKPDAIIRNLEEEIYKRITSHGLSIYKKRRVRLTETEVNLIYGHNKDKPFYPHFIKYMTVADSEPFLATLFDGRDAIKLLNEIVGYWEPEKAEKGTIRGDLAIKDFFKEYSLATQNLIHSAREKNNVISEAKLFFSEELEYIYLLI
jgi:nucleoside-diphosphate kinase